MSIGQVQGRHSDWLTSFISSVLLFLVGATFTAISGASIVKGSASQNWGAVMGSITHIERESGNRIVGAQYSYRFGNKNFKGDRVSFGFSKTRATPVLLGKRNGEPILIYVNPKSPEQSTLVAGVDSRMKLMCALSAAATLIGAAGSWLLLGRLIGGSRLQL